MKGAWSVSTFMFLCVQFVTAPLLEKTIFPPLYHLHPFIRGQLVGSVFLGLSLDCLVFPTAVFLYLCRSLPVPHCLGCCDFVVSLEVAGVSPPILFLSSVLC